MGGGKKKKTKNTVCTVCGSDINKKIGMFMKCNYCDKHAHIPCAAVKKFIASNNCFYCPDHKQHAASFFPREQVTGERTVESNTGSSKENDKSNFANISQIEHLSQVIQSMLTIQTINDSRNIPLNSTQKETPENVPLEDIIVADNSISNTLASLPRTPNMSNIQNRNSNDEKGCRKCNEVTQNPTFICRLCLDYYHDFCVTPRERNNNVGGYWGCNACTANFQEFNRQFHPQQESLRNTSKDGRSETSEWMSLFELMHKEQQKSREEMLAKMNEQFKALEHKLAQNYHKPPNNPTSQATVASGSVSVNNGEEEQVRQTVHKHSQPIITPQRGVTSNSSNLSEIEAIVEASIRRSRGLDIPPNSVNENNSIRDEFHYSNEMQRKLLENQLAESKKNSYRKLPTVKKADYQWKVFYTAFLETSDLFTDQENVTRVEEAIQCDYIRDLGGSNIFTLATYKEALNSIDKRIGKPERLLLKEKQALINFGKLSNGDRLRTIKFIQEVDKYSNLVDKIGNYQSKSDNGIISRLSRMLPEYLLNGWAREYNQIEEQTGEVLLSDMSAWLNKQIENLDRVQFFDAGDPYNEQKGQKSNQGKEKSLQKFHKKETMFVHQEENKSAQYPKRDRNFPRNRNRFNTSRNSQKESTPTESPVNFCWWHDRTGHSSLNCYSLLTKTGAEVTKLAKEKNICIICSRKSHFPCPYKSSLSCLIPDCKYKHAAIFCYMRNCRKPVDLKKNNSDNTQNNSENHLYAQQQNNDDPFNDKSIENVAQTIINALGNRGEDDNISETAMMMIERSQEMSISHTQCVETPKEIAKLSIVCVTLFNEDKAVQCALLLDSGSTMSMIENKYAKLLGLTGVKAPVQISWSGGQSREDKESCVVKVKAQGMHENAKPFDIHFRTINNLNMPKQSFNAKVLKANYTHLKKLPLFSYSQVIGVIGTDQHWFFQQQKWIKAINRKDSRESPVAILTPLGYSVIGGNRTLPRIYSSLKTRKESVCTHTEHVLSADDNEELKKMQERVMGLDYLLPYENDRKIDEEVKALKCLHDKVRKVPNENYYEAPLLFRDPNPCLPTQESYKLALKRLLILVKHAKNIGKYDEIKNEIENLIQKDYAKVLSYDEIANPPNNAFYVPIFLSAPKGKRIRLIWDAAAKVANKSLNDFLLSGPNLYVNLLSLIMQSREGKYLVKADISEMFHQIQINEKDRASLRFLFPDEKSGRIKHYEMKVMVFGAVCSPTTSQFIKNLIADQAENKFPEASRIIKHNTYVDDVVTSGNDLESMKRRIFEVRCLLKEGGFNLVKLGSNAPEILTKIRENLTQEDRENPKLFSDLEEEKLLGYLFNYKSDEIGLADITEKFTNNFFGTKVPTKRDVLRLLMSFFDPLGLFSFFTSKLKIIYHWVCKGKTDWKEEVKPEIIPFWQKVIGWIPDIMRIKIPRPYSTNIDGAIKKQLLIFGDAGKDMLCTVAYLRILNGSGVQIDYSLVASKTYTVPLNQKRSIPELELDVAEKAVEFKKLLVKSHTITFDENFYATDSACVYTWIKKGAHKATIYVQRRLGKIHASSSKGEWMWVKSEQQPADFGTKFESMPEISKSNEWFMPSIFSCPEENWFKQSPPINEQSHTSVSTTTIVPAQLKDRWIKRFSSFNKMRNTLTILYDFKNKLKTRVLKNKLSKCNSQNEMDDLNEKIKIMENTNVNDSLKAAELQLIKIAQQEMYEREIKTLQKKGRLQKHSKLYKFSPFLDKDNVLRVTTRLPPSDKFNFDKTCPIVLPKNHKLTQTIIMHYHELNKHQLHKNVTIELSQRFFIPSITYSVKKTIKECCMKCRRDNAKPDRPMMGDLPGYRLASEDPPFSYIIIDVCGPFAVRVNRKTEKRWLLVMSCLTTRSVHIEILYTMESQSLLMALENLTNIRGAPKRIISDNGSNFVGGNNILQTLQKKWDEQLAQKGLEAHKIEWEFSPAKAASMNGSVERMVALVKNVLKKMHDTLDKNLIIPSDEVFHCLTKAIIGILNNRPLTLMPIEGTDNTFLTPNYFLTQRQNCKITPRNDMTPLYQLKRWEEVKEMMGVLWDHFNRAYVHELLYRQKWIDPKRKLEVGDIIVTADPTIVNLWRLGIITKVIEGSKDQIRKVTVRLGKRNPMKLNSSTSKTEIKQKYSNEKFTEVTRPASEVAFINLRCN